MNGTLKVDSDKLKSTAGQFSNTSSQIKAATTSMAQTVQSISGSIWSGDSASAYINKFNGLQDEMVKIDKMIQEHVTDLNEMANSYDVANNTVQQQTSSLNTEIFG